MTLLTKIFVGFVAAEHIYILWFEMFAWTTVGRRVFRTLPKELFQPTKVFAANQGLYNGFLAAGLIWSLWISDPVWSKNVALFFTSCVALAGIFGGITASKSIFIKQGVPALVALLALLFV